MEEYRRTSRPIRILWLNGAFGTGKTTAAQLLLKAVPGSVLVDPEEVGSMLRPVLQPVAPVRDFQEWGAWRELVAATLNTVIRELPEDGPRLAIAPQTITEEAYWLQITAALDPEIELVPIALHVSPDEHRRRATEDSEEPGALQWRLRRFEDFREAQWIHNAFAGIDASQLSPTATASAVQGLLDRAGSAVGPPGRGLDLVRGSLRRSPGQWDWDNRV